MVEHIVEVEDVSKTFGSDIRALDGVSLTIDRGVVYGLLGPNGAGKTTLIRVLATLLRPDAGTARVAGIDVVADPRQVRTRIGLAGQYAAVDAYLTGRENVEMVGRLYGLSAGEARRRASDVLERIQLTDAADRAVKTYSGGMRRRLDLAASLVGQPDVLFLDEPTTGIDPRSRIDLWELIEDLVGGGTTVLLTTQYLDEADQLADRIGVIDDGRLITEGSSEDLKERFGGAVIELTVPAEDCRRTVDALLPVAADDVAYDERLGRLSFSAPDGSRSLAEVVRRLDAAGLEADDLTLHRPTLDDVFLSLTGRAATTTEVDGDAAEATRDRPRSRRARSRP